MKNNITARFFAIVAITFATYSVSAQSREKQNNGKKETVNQQKSNRTENRKDQVANISQNQNGRTANQPKNLENRGNEENRGSGEFARNKSNQEQNNPKNGNFRNANSGKKSNRYSKDYGYNQNERHGYGKPTWAASHQYKLNKHVYFPDYYTFYDANRGGYLYWDNGDWVFSYDVPDFLIDVDLNRARIQLMNDINLDDNPYQYYNQYAKKYPQKRSNVSVNIQVQVPYKS